MVCMCSSNKYSCIGDYTFCFYVIKNYFETVTLFKKFYIFKIFV